MIEIGKARQRLKELATIPATRAARQAALKRRAEVIAIRGELVTARRAIEKRFADGEATMAAFAPVDGVLASAYKLLGKLDNEVPLALLNTCEDEGMKLAYRQVLKRRTDITGQCSRFAERERQEMATVEGLKRRLASQESTKAIYPKNEQIKAEVASTKLALKGADADLKAVRAELAELRRQRDGIETDLAEIKARMVAA